MYKAKILKNVVKKLSNIEHQDKKAKRKLEGH